MTLAANNSFPSSPPFVTDAATLNSLPRLYRVLADELIRKGRIIVQEEERK